MLPTSLPHTVESIKTRELPPVFPTDELREQLTQEDMALAKESEEDCEVVTVLENQGAKEDQSVEEEGSGRVRFKSWKG